MFLSNSYLKDDERILSSGRKNLVTKVEEGFRIFRLKTKSSLRLDNCKGQGLYT
jgi:hypothetical protein